MVSGLEVIAFVYLRGTKISQLPSPDLESRARYGLDVGMIVATGQTVATGVNSVIASPPLVTCVPNGTLPQILSVGPTLEFLALLGATWAHNSSAGQIWPMGL